MKKEFFKHLPKFKKETNQCLKTFQQPINEIFQRVKTNFNLLDCVKLQNMIQTQKNVKPIDDNLKKKIFTFFLQKELLDFSFLKSRSKVSIRLLKLTKCKLEDKKFDWLEIWNRILRQFPQVGRKQNFQLQEFLKIIKIFYDQNNAVDVFNYFISRHGDHSEYVFASILLFSNITVNTKQQIFQQFLQQLIEAYYRAQIKPRTLLVYFINLMKKRKTVDIPIQTYKLLNNNILSSLITPQSKDGKSSIQSKFSKESAIMISQLIGKHNPYSVETLKTVFNIAQKFINPFQNSGKAVRFLYNLIRFIWKRTEKQKRAHIRLQKLLQKQKKLEQQKLKEQQLKNNNEQTKAQQPGNAEQIKQNQDDQQLNEEDQQIQSDEQKQKQDAVDQQLNEGQQELLSNEIQEKKNKCYKILKNQLTEQILDVIKEGIRKLFKYIYFVNSKKTVQQFIRYSFIMLPDLIISSLDLLDKASQIPSINEQGLISNIKITVQYMFTPDILKDSLANLPRILDRIINSNKIRQVWPIYELLFSKLPLLDQKDLQKIDDFDKQYFQKKFQLNHDRFYQKYCGNVFEAFKRMIRQGQFFNEQTVKSYQSCFEQLLLNSYPYFKKLLLTQVLEQITENSKNHFVYNFFNSHFVMNAQNQQIILEQLSLVQENQSNSTQILELKNNLVMLLCYTKPLSYLKKYIKQFASKSSFRVIPIYYTINAQFNLTTDPLSSSLKYYQENPKIKFRTSHDTKHRLNAIQELKQYAQELIEQLHKLILTPNSSTQINVKLQQVEKEDISKQKLTSIIVEMYKQNKQKEGPQSTTKISLQNIGTRKKITQLLKIINSIQSSLKHKVIDYDNQTMKFKMIDPITKRKSLLQSQKFIQIVYTLLSNQVNLHDVKLTSILSELITNELVFNYANQTRSAKQSINKNLLSNSYQQLPDYCNVYLVVDSFKQKIKLLLNSTLLNLVKKQRFQWLNMDRQYATSEKQNLNLNNVGKQQEKSLGKIEVPQIVKNGEIKKQQNQSKKVIKNQDYFEKFLEKIKILIMAPQNQKSISLMKAILITNGLKGIAQFLLSLYHQSHVQSRFYWQKLLEVFDQFKSYGVTFTIQQMIQMIDNHSKVLALQDNKKVKQTVLKSFKHLNTLMKEPDSDAKGYAQFNNIQKLQKMMRKYVDQQKFRLFWPLSVNLVLNSRKYSYFQQDHQKIKIQKIETIWDFMRILQPLIMSETRIVRRLCMFVYALCYRKVKKIIRVNSIQKVQKIQYTPKSIIDFIQTGYLRQDHIKQENRKIQNENGKVKTIKCNDNLIKIAPYEQFEVSEINQNSQLYQVYKKIQSQAFQFILKDKQTAAKFITNFHADMVSTAQQMMSTVSSSNKSQISQMVVKQLEQSFYYFVPKKLKFDKLQNFFGQRFFKYFMIKDSENGYKFLSNQKVRQLLNSSISNLDALDNQALAFIVSGNIVFAYQRNYDKLNNQQRQIAQNYLKNMYQVMIKTASGAIFKKLGMFFKKIQNQKALQFLTNIMRHQIFVQKKRICRNALIYLTIKQNDFNEHIEVLKVLLQNKLQLQNTIVNKIINTILTNPQKYPIQKQLALKYKFIDFEKQWNDGNLQKTTQRTYFIRNSDFKQYLVKTLKKYITTDNANNQNQEKNQNHQIKQNEQKNQKFNQFIKNAYALILNGINCFCHCFESQLNITKISQLIDLIYQMSLSKEQTQIIDYKQLQPILKTIFSYQFQDVRNFDIVLRSVMKLIKVLPSKRQVQILTIALHRPYNFTLLTEQRFQEVLFDILMLEQTNNNYKQLMSNISVILSFRMFQKEKFIDFLAKKYEVEGVEGKSLAEKVKRMIKNKEIKGKIILLYQCQQLALLSLNRDNTNLIMNESTKQRKNIWCREMLAIRGKKEYLDDPETYQIWKRIKENSNPYNYIA